MKSLLLVILSVLSIAPSMANNELQLLVKKVDGRMEELQRLIKENNTAGEEIAIPWNFVDEKESNLLKAMVRSYDYLKQNETISRYNFMYSGIKAASEEHPQRVTELKKWLIKENRNIYALGLSHRFYVPWKQHVASINSSIEELNQDRPKVLAKNIGSSELKNQYKFLSEMKNLVQDTIVTKAAAPEIQAIPQEKSGYTNFEYAIFLFGCLSSLTIGISFAKRRRIETKIETKIVEIKTYKDIAENREEEEEEIQIQSPSLEEQCQRLIDNNLHLLEVADLKVYPGLRSPFKTTVNAPKEKVYEALEWLLKGTIAIANANGTKITSMEWDCTEKSGRVSLEFILHGLECDFKSLYLNTLVDGNFSAPAHFGRSENALSGHYPTVAFKSGNKKTTVSLGLDSISNQINH